MWGTPPLPRKGATPLCTPQEGRTCPSWDNVGTTPPPTTETIREGVTSAFPTPPLNGRCGGLPYSLGKGLRPFALPRKAGRAPSWDNVGTTPPPTTETIREGVTSAFPTPPLNGRCGGLPYSLGKGLRPSALPGNAGRGVWGIGTGGGVTLGRTPGEAPGWGQGDAG